AMTSRKQQQKYIRKIVGKYINTNHLPVFFDAKFIGFVHTYENVTKIQNLEQTIRKQLLDKGFVAKYTFDDIVTTDPVMAMVKETAASYAGSNSALLIEGESGTGKELFAQSLHNASRRRGGPFVAVNCAAIPANLLESELFGYEAGAFTGAKKEGRQGLFEVAHTGTIFLDEIGDLPKEFQARLLRVLQEKELMRVGGNRVIPVDVRIISATNKNLRELAREGFFREDLYYRLSVFSITVPPLRARKGDIMPLFRHFFREMGVTPDEETLKRFMPQLLGHSWPGNVRELQNIAERLAHAQQHLQGMDPARSHFTLGLSDSAKKGELAVTVDMERHESLKSAVEAVEWEIIDYLLKAHDKNYGEVAKRLGIGRTTLWRKYTRNEA
ncbi:MAG: sigma 54-interacting transcriptional regulator, partial [Deltaproteobacteria bacterium]|nr:sigma 54-interacting transcriptional regulator [Deltaproteobacteria bacterium]